MFKDLYKSGSTCPICRSELQTTIFNDETDFITNCNNRCFSFSGERLNVTVRIFDEFFSTTKGSGLVPYNYKVKKYLPYIESIIKDKIDYWKENDRYLAEILEIN